MELYQYRTDTWNIQLSNGLLFQMAIYPNICNMAYSSLSLSRFYMTDYLNDFILKLD